MDPNDAWQTTSAVDCPQKNKYPCSVCGRFFKAPSNLEVHMRSHTGERPAACSVCGQRFSRHWSMVRHKNTVHGPDPSNKYPD